MEQVIEIDGALRRGEDGCRIGDSSPVRVRAFWKCGHSDFWDIKIVEKDREKIASRKCNSCQNADAERDRIAVANPVAVFQQAALAERAAKNGVTAAVQEQREYFERWGTE
jgi:hypothetical protein